jgi:hypothetical protein
MRVIQTGDESALARRLLDFSSLIESKTGIGRALSKVVSAALCKVIVLDPLNND